VAFLILFVVLGGSFAAGYFTRDYISRKRRTEAWRRRHDPDFALDAANSNDVIIPQAPGGLIPQAPSDLGQMLNRWESRARDRRSQQSESDA
jgi:hypothetical protein